MAWVVFSRHTQGVDKRRHDGRRYSRRRRGGTDTVLSSCGIRTFAKGNKGKLISRAHSCVFIPKMLALFRCRSEPTSRFSDCSSGSTYQLPPFYKDHHPASASRFWLFFETHRPTQDGIVSKCLSMMLSMILEDEKYFATFRETHGKNIRRINVSQNSDGLLIKVHAIKTWFLETKVTIPISRVPGSAFRFVAAFKRILNSVPKKLVPTCFLFASRRVSWYQ